MTQGDAKNNIARIALPTDGGLCLLHHPSSLSGSGDAASKAPGARSGWASYPGLRFPGHTAGSRGRGRIQLAVKRAFVAAGTSTLTTSDVFDYALARHRKDGWRQQQRWSVVRVLRQMCDPIGRDRRYGAIIWRLKTPAADTSSAPSD